MTRPAYKNPTPEITGIHKLPLFGALGLALLALIVVAGAQIIDAGKVKVTLGNVVDERTLLFRDEPGGIVHVMDANSKETLAKFGTGEGAFLRQSVRSMALKRSSKNMQQDLPFRLVRDDKNRLALTDPETGHFITLNGFGAVAIRDYAQFLPNQPAALEAPAGHSGKGA